MLAHCQHGRPHWLRKRQAHTVREEVVRRWRNVATQPDLRRGLSQRFKTEDTETLSMPDSFEPREHRTTDLHAPTPESRQLHLEPVELEVPGVLRITLLAASHSCIVAIATRSSKALFELTTEDHTRQMRLRHRTGISDWRTHPCSSRRSTSC